MKVRIRISRGSISESLPKTLAIQISRLFLPVMLVVSFSLNAWAQENVGDDSTIVYPFAYFSEYAPVTALDMLNRIPGMEISSIGGSSRGGSSGGSFSNVSRGGRGLGSGSSGTQILINGKRTAGKNNNTETQLRRVDADQVDYIEIIRGTSGDLDVRGSTQIANIVLFEEISNTSINYEVNANYYSDNNSEPGGSLTYAGQTGDLNFIVNASAVPNYNFTQLRENSILPGELPNDFIDEERIRDNTTYTLSTNLDYQLNTK